MGVGADVVVRYPGIVWGGSLGEIVGSTKFLYSMHSDRFTKRIFMTSWSCTKGYICSLDTLH